MSAADRRAAADTGATEGCDVVVVGAGMAGATAARVLAADGADVVVLDKSVCPGGRLATRRIGDARLDHGAQFFTVRSDELAALVDDLRRDGCPIRVWGRGFAQVEHVDDGPGAADTTGDGHPRFCVRGGMNQLVRALARHLDVRTRALVTRIEPAAGRWRVTAADGRRVAARRLLVTTPVPQALALVAAGGDWLDEPTRRTLGAISYDPCLAVLLRLDASPALPDPGGVQLQRGPVRFLGDNAAKGASATPALTVHLSADVSRAHWDAADADTVSEVIGWLRPWLGATRVGQAEVARWRFAQPRGGPDDRAVAASVDGCTVVFAGDAYGEAKVEGAARSGMAAARALATS